MVDHFVFILMSVATEWEAAKNAEPVKEVIIQPTSVETPVVSNTHTESYSQQVTMMPVQVLTTLSICG